MSAQPDLSGVRHGDGLTTRAATVDDVAVVCELINACEKHDLGEELLDEEEILADWQRPSFDIGTESAAIFDGGRLIAYGEVYKGSRADAYVLPSERGRGLGSALMRWTWEVSRNRGGSDVGQPVVVPSDAVALFESMGYSPRWTSWILEVPPGAALDDADLPPGITLRAFRLGQDEREAFDVIENAFSEWPDREPALFEDWLASAVQRPGFEPWQLQLAVEESPDGSSAIVGVGHVTMSGDDAWIPALAVRRDRRGLGLGRVVLVAAFAAARARGAASFELCTDSRTGALGVYEHVGMRVKQTFVRYSREV